MPPKKSANQPNKKTEEKKKDKIIEDRTFGLKNKKGAKQQRYIKMVTQQVKYKGQSIEKIESQKHDEKKKKLDDELDDLNKILKPVVAASKVAKDVDPKSVLCMLFKSGMCSKGDKCKFSHDLSLEGKAEKRNIYVDKREITDDDNIENWDEAKLNEVVEQKHGESNRNKPRTAIICKHFLKALEECKYGWFWICPNGDSCIYRHAVPPGYVLRKDRVKLEQMKTAQEEVSLEDLIEKERAALGDSLPKVTLDSFLKWKERKRKEKLKERSAEEKRKRSEYISGKELGLSGRELFTFNPDLMAQDDEEADETEYKPNESENEEEEQGVEINEDMFLKTIGAKVDAELFMDEDLSDIDEADADESADVTEVEGPLVPEPSESKPTTESSTKPAPTCNGSKQAGDDEEQVSTDLAAVSLSERDR